VNFFVFWAVCSLIACVMMTESLLFYLDRHYKIDLRLGFPIKDLCWRERLKLSGTVAVGSAFGPITVALIASSYLYFYVVERVNGKS